MPSSHSGTQGYLIDRRLPLLWNPSAQGCCRPRPPICPLTGGLSDWDHLPPADWGGLASDGWRQVLLARNLVMLPWSLFIMRKSRILCTLQSEGGAGAHLGAVPLELRELLAALPQLRGWPRVVPWQRLQGQCAQASQGLSFRDMHRSACRGGVRWRVRPPPRDALQQLRYSARKFHHEKFYLRWLLLGAGPRRQVRPPPPSIAASATLCLQI